MAGFMAPLLKPTLDFFVLKILCSYACLQRVTVSH
jgi:hypothetical protein